MINGRVIKLMSFDRVSYCKLDTESDRDVEKLITSFFRNIRFFGNS